MLRGNDETGSIGSQKEIEVECCDVVIPVYNAPEWLSLCVEAIFLSDVSNVVRQVILVDDCSNQETQELIQKLCKTYNKLKSVRNTKNSGFVKSCNRGMAMCESDYIMLLNSDCLLAADTAAKMILLLREKPQAGLICPLSNNAANLSIPIPSNTNYVQVDEALWEKLPSKYYPACTVVGNCMIITKACHASVGGLDEVFGMGYGEETDYQFRAGAAGFDAIVAGNVYVFHKSQASFGNNNTLDAQKKRNREIFFSRWQEQYTALLKEYEKNDPVAPAAEFLSWNAAFVSTTSYFPFPSSFFERLGLIIDRQELATNQGKHSLKPGILSRSCAYFREFGFCAFVKKVVWKIFGVNRAIAVSKSIPAPIEGVHVYFKDLLVVYNDKSMQRLTYLEEILSYAGISTDALPVQQLRKSHLKWYRGCLLLDLSAEDLPDSFFVACKKNHKVIIADGNQEVLRSVVKQISGVFLREKQDFGWWGERGIPALYVPQQETDAQLADLLTELQAEMALPYSPRELHQFVESLFPPAIAFVLPHIKPVGGIQVVFEHIRMLQQFGYDAFVINLEGNEIDQVVGGSEIWVLNGNVFISDGHLDKMVATQGHTVRHLDEWQKKGEKYYLVQGQEVLFFPFDESHARQEVSRTYLRDDIHYLTVSPWCQRWLKEDYGRDAKLVPNGLDLGCFPFKQRETGKKTVVLIEGNCNLASKNIDESFKIANRLNKDEFYIIFVTNYGKPKEWYVYDEFYCSVPHQEIYRIYWRADILLKTSLMESFSYPPLEMMATGGCVVAIPNNGNINYLEDGYNCLLFQHGDAEAGVAAIKRLRQNPELRAQIAVNGRNTAEAWAWVPDKILQAYGETSISTGY